MNFKELVSQQQQGLSLSEVVNNTKYEDRHFTRSGIRLGAGYVNRVSDTVESIIEELK